MGASLAARISGEISLGETAEPLCESMVSLPTAFPYNSTVARLGLALLAVQRGDATEASNRYAELESKAGIMLLFISTDRVLGLLAQTMGNLNQATAHFEDALSFCRKAGYRPNLAWTCFDYAEALLQRASTSSARTDDRQKAMSLLDEALAISTELGMRPLMERAQDRRDRIGSTVPEIPDYPSGLSQREVEVLRLLALGKSNREIGVELVITEGTVRRHVSNVYDKIGVSNRTEATRYALREGFVSFE